MAGISQSRSLEKFPHGKVQQMVSYLLFGCWLLIQMSMFPPIFHQYVTAFMSNMGTNLVNTFFRLLRVFSFFVSGIFFLPIYCCFYIHSRIFNDVYIRPMTAGIGSTPPRPAKMDGWMDRLELAWIFKVPWDDLCSELAPYKYTLFELIYSLKQYVCLQLPTSEMF